MWKPIETLPSEKMQVLVTAELPTDTDPNYESIELCVTPMLPDGQLFNVNSGNYSRANSWKWWMHVPTSEKE